MIVRNFLPISMPKNKQRPAIRGIERRSMRKKLANPATNLHLIPFRARALSVPLLISLVHWHILISKESVANESRKHANSQAYSPKIADYTRFIQQNGPPNCVAGSD